MKIYIKYKGKHSVSVYYVNEGGCKDGLLRKRYR